MSQEPQERSLSSLLGCGCAALVAVVLFVIVAVTFLTYRAGKRFEEMERDPEVAGAETRRVLPHDELPAGYVPRGALSIPFLMKIAMFEGPDEAAETGGERGSFFLFAHIRTWLDSDRDLDRLLTGESDELPIQQDDFQFRPAEVVGRGELEVGGHPVTWLARRGDVDNRLVDAEEGEEPGVVIEWQGHGGDEGAPGDTPPSGEHVLTLMKVDCGEESWQTVGVWFVPDPAPETPAEGVDWTGTPADPRALEDFLGHFELCA